MGIGRRVINWSGNHINLIVLLGMIVAGNFVSGQFLTIQNWQNILRQVSVNGIMAAGVTGVYLAGGFDLSVGAILSLCGCLGVGLQAFMPVWAAVAVSLTAGGAIGALNGFLLRITRGELSETFLITLGTSLVTTALALTYTNGQSLFVTRGTAYDFIGQGKLYGIPVPALLFLVIVAILQFVLKKTAYGRKIYLTGGNKEASWLSGMDTRRIKLSVFVIAGVCAAIGGIIMSSRTTTAVYSMGNGADFDACIAVLIGGNVLGGGKGGMVETVIGVFIFGLISNLLNLAAAASEVQMILKGAILLLAILLNGIKTD